MKRKSQIIRSLMRGFTLLEILVVLFILGISGVIVVPMVFYSIENVTFKTSVKHLAAVMRFARSESINHKSIEVLELNIEGKSYTLKENKNEGGTSMGGQNNDGSDMTGDSGAGFPSGDEENTGGISGNANAIYDVPHKLGKDLEFKKVIVNDMEMTQGFVKIYFFPKGNTSGGKVLIANNKGKVFSITLESITGRVVVKKEENNFYG